MKIVVTSGLSFKPAALPAQIDFTGACDPKGRPVAITPATLLAVLNTTNPGPLFAAGKPGLGGRWDGPGSVPTRLALQAPTLGMLSTDQLVVVIDDGRVAAGDDTLLAFATQAHLDAGAVEAILATLATEHTLDGLDDDLNNFAAHNRADLHQLDADVNAFAGANHSDLTKLNQDLDSFAAQEHADQVKLDADLNTASDRNHADITAASDRNHVDVTAFSDRNHADMGQLDTDLTAAAAQAHQDSGRLDTDVNGFASANHADLGRIEALLSAQRQETLWTDDSRAYFVRLDNRGAITWTDISGNPSAPPGAGARPAAGDDALLDKSSYQVITAGTGYAVGDLVDHVTTTDPTTGALVGHFWINLTQAAKINAPASADIEPLSRLPDDAARASLQSSIGTQAHTDAQKLDTDLNAASDRNHTDLTILDTDLKTGFGQAHTDAAANHQDLVKLDTDVNGFATANHQDMVTLAATTGAPGDAPAPDDVAPASVIALLRRGLARWATFLGRFPTALGATTIAGSVPVTVASDQVVPVSGTAAIGSAPDHAPLSVSGVDGSGLKRHLLTDATGALLTLPFAPLRGATTSLSVGPVATTHPVALPAGVATSYRVRNAATSPSPATWILAPDNGLAAVAPTIPQPFDATGAGGAAGDKTIDPGGVEVIGLTAAQQVALAAGTLFLSAICPAGGSAVLSVTPGSGA